MIILHSWCMTLNLTLCDENVIKKSKTTKIWKSEKRRNQEEEEEEDCKGRVDRSRFVGKEVEGRGQEREREREREREGGQISLKTATFNPK